MFNIPKQRLWKWTRRWPDDSNCLFLKILFITFSSCSLFLCFWTPDKQSHIRCLCTSQMTVLICDGLKTKWHHSLTFFPLKNGIDVLSLSLGDGFKQWSHRRFCNSLQIALGYSFWGKHCNYLAEEATCRCSGLWSQLSSQTSPSTGWQPCKPPFWMSDSQTFALSNDHSPADIWLQGHKKPQVRTAQPNPSQIPDPKLMSNIRRLLFYDAKFCGNSSSAMVGRTPPSLFLLHTKAILANFSFTPWASDFSCVSEEWQSRVMWSLFRAKANFVSSLAWFPAHNAFPQIWDAVSYTTHY